MAKTTNRSAKKVTRSNSKIAEEPVKYTQSLEQQLDAVTAELKKLHEEVVIPFRKKRSELRDLRKQLRLSIKKSKSDAKTGAREAKKVTKIKAQPKPTPGESQWREKRNANGGKTSRAKTAA